MSPLQFFLSFFGGLAFLVFLSVQMPEGIVPSTSKESPQSAGTYTTSREYASETSVASTTPSPYETEAERATLLRETYALKEKAEEMLIESPTSPYSTLVSLRIGNVRSEDSDEEYLVLTASPYTTTSLDITDWYLVSLVTGKRARLGESDPFPRSRFGEHDERTILSPREYAYIVSGNSPVEASFQENMCTGYLREATSFSPSIALSCPLPLDELERFGSRVDLDDDACYDVLEYLPRCTEPETALSSRQSVGSACSQFIRDTLNYSDCIQLHSDDPFFRLGRPWHIYLDERYDLFRSEREIIRLMDEEDRVVSVMSY